MQIENLDKKIKIYGAFLMAMLLLLTITLAFFTLGQGQKYAEKAERNRTQTLSVNGQRGEITDRNGVVLATNRKSFDIQFDRDVSKNTAKDRALFTQSLIRAIGVIEENGGKVLSNFSLKKNENNELYLDFSEIDEKERPKRETRWRQNFFVDNGETPDEIYTKLRARYQIPETVNYEDAYKLLSIWQEVQMNSYRSYYPIIISTDVDQMTLSELEMQDFYLDCIQIKEEYARVYPKGNTAAHIMGYVGTEAQPKKVEQNEALGYVAADELGMEGIEAALEKQLTGSTNDRKGKRVVEVNSMGKVIRELSSTPAKSGDSAMLTTDYELQKKAEEALAQNIKDINAEQRRLYAKDKAKYDEKAKNEGKTGDQIKYAQQGGVVVMNPKNGEVLAMASYPDYDPNVFVGGISAEEYKQLKGDKERAPLYNKAISDGTPGSVFKMVTSVAALMEGEATVNTTISDRGEFRDHMAPGSTAKGPSCWTKTPSIHPDQNVTRAIQNSCNYYFYTVSYRMGIEKLNKWADQLGLTSSTNIELPGEVKGKVGNQKVLYDNRYSADKQEIGVPVLVKNQIVGYLKQYNNQNPIQHNEDEMKQTAEELMRLVDGSGRDLSEDIRTILANKLDISKATSYANRWDAELLLSLNQLQWSANDTITTAIGQGITTVTPVATARYVSALVNGGKVFDARLVKSTVSAEGKVTEKQSKIYNTVDIDKSYISAIKQGMRNVVAHNDGVQGTAANYFEDWSDERKQMLGGKTGTAEVNSIDIEHSAWFVGFAPYDDPEIVVVVFIPNGYSGGRASYTVKEIMELYLDRREQQTKHTLQKTNG